MVMTSALPSACNACNDRSSIHSSKPWNSEETGCEKWSMTRQRSSQSYMVVNICIPKKKQHLNMWRMQQTFALCFIAIRQFVECKHRVDHPISGNLKSEVHWSMYEWGAAVSSPSLLVSSHSPTGTTTCPTPLVVSTWLNTGTCFCPTIPGSLISQNTHPNGPMLSLHKHINGGKSTFFPQLLKYNLNCFHWQFSWSSVKIKHTQAEFWPNVCA